MERLVIKITVSIDDPERAHVACNVASVALAAGTIVELFLSREGVRLALPDLPLEVPDAPPIGDLLKAIYALGKVTVCAPCAARRGLVAEQFMDGTVMAGSAAFVEAIMTQGTQALVY